MKAFVIGGEKDVLHRNEIQRIADWVNRLAQQMVQLRPYRSFLFFSRTRSRTEKVSEKDFREGFLSLRQSLRVLFPKNSSTPEPDSLSWLPIVRFTVDRYWGEGASKKYKKIIDLLPTYKEFLFADNRELLTSNQLPVFLDELLSAYETYLQFEYFVRSPILFSDISTLLTFPALVPSTLKEADVYQGAALEYLPEILNRSLQTMIARVERSETKKLPRR